MPCRIETYALIGNRQTAGLVGANGSIEWLCLPNFDSAAPFAELVGNQENGYWQIAPNCEFRVRRRYIPGTLVLETLYESWHGAAVVIDFMFPDSRRADVIRLIRGVRGEIRMRMELRARMDYGSIIPWVKYSGGQMVAIGGPDMLHLNTNVELKGDNRITYSDFTVKEGQKIHFLLNWHPSHVKRPPVVKDPWRELNKTKHWWMDWSSKSTYRGKYQEAVERSLITLKALTHEPTGGIVAAPTTSLPERIGGIRNWDYRYCWVRDSTFTLCALIGAGYLDEATAWREWLLRAVAGAPDDLRIMYSITGKRRLPEMELEWLEGHNRSRPVRIGNLASQQFQLDVYGEILDTLYLARREHLRLEDASWNLQWRILNHLEKVWQLPDSGIWEVRGPERHFTHSKVMAWVALDRGIRTLKHYGLPGPVERWNALKDRIRDEILARGFDSQKGSFVQFYGGKGVDAALLLLPLVGFISPRDPRMLGTVKAIENELMDQGFVRRYVTNKENVDGLPGTEGAFIACTLWLADNYALQGRMTEATELMERVLGIRNDVGLLSEEYDPDKKMMLGNFPQAFSHVALINTAQILSNSLRNPVIDRAA